jgi:hypothetical protein
MQMYARFPYMLPLTFHLSLRVAAARHGTCWRNVIERDMREASRDHGSSARKSPCHSVVQLPQ